MKNYPLLSLQKLNHSYARQLKEAAARVIDSGWYLHGAETEALEAEICHFLGCRYAIGVGNGLDSLRLIFRAYIELGRLRPGDEVIVPANTFMASVLALTANGLVPRFVEPSVHTHNLDTEALAHAVTPRVKAILVVHLYGRACWDDSLVAVARDNGLIVVEDNAQAIGARPMSDASRRTGALGDAAGTSFYPGKNLGALGDAGIVTTSDAAVAEMVRNLANYGGSRRYVYEHQGINSRIDELQAAFLRVKLPFVDAENSRRDELARRYDQKISNPCITLPEIPCRGSHVWHQYVVRTPYREAFMHHLQEQGIATGIHYPIPPHKQEAYGEYNTLSLPVTEMLAREVVSMPIAPYLTDDDIDYIAAAVNSFRP